jgi:hypothetical protein
LLGDGCDEGEPARIINGRVGAGGEGSVVLRLVGGKEVFEIFLGFILEDSAVRCPGSIRELKSVDSIFFPSDNGLGMEEGAIFITKLDPFFSGLLVL